MRILPAFLCLVLLGCAHPPQLTTRLEVVKKSDGLILVTLRVVKRLPTGKTPIVGTFSPDGQVHFTGHAADTVVVAHDTKTFKEVWRARVGTFPEKVGVHPAGTFVYAILSREAAVAVLNARTGRVVTQISLGTNPTGIFVRGL